MYIYLIVWCHPCPIWPPVFPLKITYTYFDISIATVMNESALYRFLTLHVPNLMSIFLSLGHLSEESVQVPSPLWHFITSLSFTVWSCQTRAQPPNWRTNWCWLSSAAYSIYSQLPSISRGRLLHPQPEDAPCHSDKGPA
jgi:hypothetical protein